MMLIRCGEREGRQFGDFIQLWLIVGVEGSKNHLSYI